MSGPRQPYQGYRILDFSQVLAGPVATQLLNASGAEVIKIEPPSGDQLRSLPMSQHQRPDEPSAAFVAANRGKQSLTLNVTTHRRKRRCFPLTAGSYCFNRHNLQCVGFTQASTVSSRASSGCCKTGVTF